MRIIERELSLCSNCLRVIPADIVEENGKVYMVKNHCQSEKVLLDNDAKFFKKWNFPFRVPLNIRVGQSYEELRREILKEWFSDPHLYVTLKCNMNCPICFQKCYLNKGEDLTKAEIEELLKTNKAKRIFLSGGEPTMREDLADIIKFITKKGRDVIIITNGLKLLDKNYIRSLKEAGLKEVGLSFDGFSDKAYKKLRGRRLLRIKMRILKNLKEMGMKTSLGGVFTYENLDQIEKIIKFACLNMDFIRTLYFIPLSRVLTPSDICKEVAKALRVRTDYFIEWRKFYFNAYKLLGKLGKRIQKNFSDLSRLAFLIKVENGKPKPLLSIKEIKELNSFLENPIRIRPRYIIRLLKLLILYFSHRGDSLVKERILRKEKILKICINEIVGPFNIRLKKNTTLGDYKIAYDGGLIKIPCQVLKPV